MEKNQHEDVINAKKIILDWFGQAEWKEKYDLMRSLVGAVPPSEAKTFENLCNKARKRTSKRKNETGVGDADPSKRTRVEPVLLEPVPPTPQKEPRTKGWWKEYRRANIVGLDCEHVSLLNVKGHDNIRAGSVAVVNYKGETLYYAKIKHAPFTFRVDKFTRRCNGFTERSLEDGKDLEVVQKELEAILTGKLIITHSGTCDFDSLMMSAGDYDHFDIGEVGETLAEIWSQRVIDNYEVEAEYVNLTPLSGAGLSGTDSAHETYLQSDEFTLTEEWKSRHVRQSQYLLQIVKCNDLTCCKAPATNLCKFLKGQFLPAPAKFGKNCLGVYCVNDGSANSYFPNLALRLCFDFLVPETMPYDQFCPSVSAKVHEKICSVCKQYFVSKKALSSHRQIHAQKFVVSNSLAEDENEVNPSPQSACSNIFIINDLTSWLRTPFMEIDNE